VIFLFATLALVSFGLNVWQWLVAIRFPLHRRSADKSFTAGITLLKPLKGADATTRENLRSWFAQNYLGEVQILFGVAEENDPASAIIRELIKEFPDCDARLVVCPESLGANAKVSKLIQLLRAAKHEVVVVSDADVRVPEDFLVNAVVPLRDEKVGLVNCFYRLANPATLAMQWEATAANADFWSQVLQSRSLKPVDFALGAVMATRRKQIEEIGGFEAIANCLADDYQLGNRIAKRGHRIEISPVVVECWDSPIGLSAVWKHQLRWARTIRVCQPVPYFFSILSNVTLWAVLFFLISQSSSSLLLASVALGFRVVAAVHLQRRLEGNWRRAIYFWLAPVKDLLQAAVWLLAFAGNSIEWRGEKYRLRRDGTLEKLGKAD